MELSLAIFIRTATNHALAAIAYNRFKAVMMPAKYHKNSYFCSELLIQAYWIIALIVGSTAMLAPAKNMSKKRCSFYGSIKSYHLLIYAVVGKILPFIFIVIAYAMILGKIRKVS